jgi:hypothetical protein
VLLANVWLFSGEYFDLSLTIFGCQLRTGVIKQSNFDIKFLISLVQTLTSGSLGSTAAIS